MSDNKKYVQLLFVVETNKETKSDDGYIFWLMRRSFSKYMSDSNVQKVVFKINFVHMDGKHNYSKEKVKRDIKTEIEDYYYGETEVIYCIDIDSGFNEDERLVNSISDYCSNNKYYLILFNREIEDVVNAPFGKTKKERIRKFLDNNPKYESVSIDDLRVKSNNVHLAVGTSNFNLIIEKIIEKQIK